MKDKLKPVWIVLIFLEKFINFEEKKLDALFIIGGAVTEEAGGGEHQSIPIKNTQICLRSKKVCLKYEANSK